MDLERSVRGMIEPRLSRLQRDLLECWLPGYRVVRDHCWGLVETTVLELLNDGRRYSKGTG